LHGTSAQPGNGRTPQASADATLYNGVDVQLKQKRRWNFLQPSSIAMKSASAAQAPAQSL
jgi:hypothetical protein